MTASSSVSWSRCSPPSNFVHGHVLTMWFMVCCWPQSQEGDWVRPHLCKLAQHGPCMTREIEAWLSDSRVSSNSVVDHRSRRPVLSPLRNCVDRCHVSPCWVWRCKPRRCKPWRCMRKDISTHRPIWMGFEDLKHTVSCCFTT